MQTLPKNLNELFKIMKDSESETFQFMKGAYFGDFQSVLSNFFDDKHSFKNMANYKIYAYSRNYKTIITLESQSYSEERLCVVKVEKAWRDKDILQSLLESRNMMNYEITDRIGGRNATKELILVKVNDARHLFDQDEFEALGYYIVFKMISYDDLLK